MPNAQVHHDQDEHRFVVAIDDAEAELTYRRVDEHVVDFDHTFTPPALRGQGVAGTLVRAGLAWAREQGLQVIPGCPYVAAFFDKHPEVADLRAP